MTRDYLTLDTGPSGVPWGARHVVLGVLLFIACLLVAISLYEAAKWALGADPGLEYDLVILGMGISILMLVAAWAMGPGAHRTSFASLGLRLPTKPMLLYLALPIPVFLASLTFTFAYTLIVSALGWHALEPPSTPLGDIEIAGSIFIPIFLLVVLVGPFAEEVLFRGFIYPGIANSFGPLKAALLTSALFALAHQQLGVMVPIFITGLMLAWLYHQSRSIWPSFIAHGAQNALALAVFAWGMD